MAKENFLISEKWGKMFLALSDEKAGQLIKAIYQVRQNPDYEIDDPILSAVFEMIKDFITENEQKYREKCEKMVANGKVKKQKEANASKSKQLLQEESKEGQIESEKSLSYSLSIKEIVDYLNIKTGKSYKASTKGTREHINARLAEGFSVDDFKRVIDYKTQQWLHDPRMADYLRPETLFCSKFEGYLQSAPKVVSNMPPDIPDKYAGYERVTLDDM